MSRRSDLKQQVGNNPAKEQQHTQDQTKSNQKKENQQTTNWNDKLCK